MSVAHRRAVVGALTLLALVACVGWARLHAARLERDAELAAVCTPAGTRADLDRSYAAFGIAPVETFPGDPSRLTYTTLVTSWQSFACLVELDGDHVRSARPFRMAYAETMPRLAVPRWAPGWADDAAQAIQRLVSSLGTVLTP